MARLAEHFDSQEFESASNTPLPSTVAARMVTLALMLEEMRAAGGDFPITITSFYRSPEHNAAIGGSSTSDHITGDALDAEARNTDVTTWARNIVAARRGGHLGPWGQLIIYPHTDGHFHVSIAGAHNHLDQILVEVGDKPERYATWDGVGDVPPWGSGGLGAGGSLNLPSDEGGSTSPDVLVVILCLLVAIIVAAVAAGD